MGKQITHQQTKQDQRRERREEQQRREQQRLRVAKTRRIVIIGAVAALVIAITAVVYFIFAINLGQNTRPGAPVDGISCDQLEHSTVHYHAHVSIYINGTAVQIPANVGISTISTEATCFYWMHTHTDDGIIHIEAPSQQPYTLGNFFHIWSEQFPQLGYLLQLGDSHGWTAYVNGQPYKGDFRSIPLQSHMLVTLVYNSPNAKPDIVYNWGHLTK
jgi:hypothetical protein